MSWRSLLLVLGVGLLPAMGHDPLSWPRVDSDDPHLVSLGGTLSSNGRPLTGYVERRYDSGNLAALTPYLAGRRHGTAYRWFENGRPQSSRGYRGGTKQGPQLGFWPNGTRRFHYLAEAGLYQGTYRAWHDNGELGALGHFEAGREQGAQRSWDRSGRLLSNYVVKDGRRYGLLDAKPCFTVDEGDL